MIKINAEKYLENLLAVIHRDGGHYAARVGLKKSVDDALVRLPRAYGVVDAAKHFQKCIDQNPKVFHEALKGLQDALGLYEKSWEERNEG